MPPRVHSALSRAFVWVSLCFVLSLGMPARALDTSQSAEQTLAAAEAAMNIGDDRQAESLLSRIPPSALGVAQGARAQILRSSISLKRGLPMAALQALPTGSEHVPLYADRIEELRGTALFELDDPVAATRSLVVREHYLQNDPEACADNHDLIWRGLMRVPLSRADVSRIAVQDEVTRGWLELALQAQQGPAARFDEWRLRYPQHPAESRLPGLIAAQKSAGGMRQNPTLRMAPSMSVPPATAQAAPMAPAAVAPPVAAARPPAPYVPPPTTYSPPGPAVATMPFVSSGGGRGYALLVPLTGPFAATGEAVRSGFMAAAGSAAGDVRVYDSGTGPNQALEAFQTALSEGAGVIVGPLQRESVVAIARLGTPPVPVVALNALDDATAPPGNFLQFGLAPEDEAAAAAEQAVAQNQRRAVSLVPSTDWGRRVFAAFATRLRELGGTVIASDVFESGTVDPSKTIKHLLGMDASEGRHKALTAVLGSDTEFDGRRRADVDFIFLAAKPSDSRVILPQLRFFRADGLPIYSTSLIYEGRAIEWTNTRICDMPWMMDTSGNWASARTNAVAQMPDAMRSYPRLVALGGDAWRLAGRLAQHHLQGDEQIDGATGRLHIGGDGRVHRELTCSAPNGALSQALTPGQ